MKVPKNRESAREPNNLQESFQPP